MGGGWWGRSDAKRQYLRRLHKRFGAPWTLTFDDDFAFDLRGVRWQNIDQLEAIVEFYVNFREPPTAAHPDGLPCGPWVANAKPLSPGDAGYRTVSLRPPSGTNARIVAGTTVSLDGAPDLSMVRVDPAANPLQPGFQVGPPPAGLPPTKRFLFDTIEIDADTSRAATHRFRIVAVDNAANPRTVTLDVAPVFKPGTTRSSWRLHTQPILVLIDPVGARERGGVILHDDNPTATVTGHATPTQAIVTLGGPPDLSRVNPAFDTIYLAGDTRAGRGQPFRAYRIIARDNAANTVTLDGDPNLGGGGSPWYIPAGLGATGIPSLQYNLHPPAAPAARAARGADHYDGLMFIVHDGEVTHRFRWNSYTSRDHGPWGGAGWDQLLSSIQGNDAYFYESFVSGNAFINYTFAVTDAVPGNQGLDHDPNDHIANAWFHFGTPDLVTGALDGHVTRDTQPAPAGGKTAIRIHRGSANALALPNGGGCGSAGCIVSPQSATLRWSLVARYRKHYEGFHGRAAQDTFLPQICQNVACECTTYIAATPNNGCTGNWPAGKQIPDAQWVGKLNGVLWVIRPDEPPPS